jgi:hypothetical protein
MGRRKKDVVRVEQSYGVMPFVLEEVDAESTLTARSGLVCVVEAARAMGLARQTQRSVSIKQRERGYSEWEFVESLVALIAGGGQCLDDLRVLQADRGFVSLLGHEIPSASAAKKFLYGFEDAGQVEHNARQRDLMPSYVPQESTPLLGLEEVNRHLIRQAQRSGPQRTATLDHDGTIIESAKRSAAMTYQGTTGYQPSVVLWAEQDLIVADEFRDGNVPAGCDVRRVAQRAFDALPETVEQVYYRADSASYNHELLNWLREEDENGHPRAIFAVSADMSPQLKEAVLAVEDWHADPDDACRSWGEVDFVPSDPSTKKGRKPDRYLAIRIVPRQKELFADGSSVKYFAVVTNDFERGGLELIDWHRQKAGTIEHTHNVLKNDLAADVMPCDRFGSNAAWLRLNVITYNLLSVLKRTALPEDLHTARPKRLRFLLFNIAGELIRHARQTIVRVTGALDHCALRLSQVRRRLLQQTPVWEAPG